MVFDFRAELVALADRIRRHPMLELREFTVGDPTPEATITAVQARLGRALPSALGRLYRQLSSTDLDYRCRPDPQAHNEVSEDPGAGYDGWYDEVGAIKILPLEEMLFDEQYTLLQPAAPEDTWDFDGVTYLSNDFDLLVRPFDAACEAAAMSFIVQPEREDWKLMWLPDWCEYDHSRVIWPTDYLEYLIATWGLVDSRNTLFDQYRGDLLEPVRFDPGIAAATLPAFLRA